MDFNDPNNEQYVNDWLYINMMLEHLDYYYSNYYYLLEFRKNQYFIDSLFKMAFLKQFLNFGLIDNN